LVDVAITVPESLTPQEEELMKAFAEARNLKY
jgi:DnaJ-class molecular chaperone